MEVADLADFGKTAMAPDIRSRGSLEGNTNVATPAWSRLSVARIGRS